MFTRPGPIQNPGSSAVLAFANPQCFNCAHRNIGAGVGWTCAAFPDGIPDPIMNDEFDHRQSYPGDHGIQFAALEGRLSPFEARERKAAERARQSEDKE